MTLLAHVYALKNLLTKGVASDDFSLSNRLIAHYLQISRALLIERKTDKYHFISEQSYQSLCVNLELSQFHNCCNDVTLECKVLKSTTKLPKFLNSRWGNFLKVMDLTGIVIPEFSRTSDALSKYALVTPKEGWFLHDNYLYIVNSKVLETVLLNALFEDPQEIHDLNCPNKSGECLDFMESEFPIDSDLVEPMYEITFKMLTRSFSIPKDNENDSSDTQITNGTK